MQPFSTYSFQKLASLHGKSVEEMCEYMKALKIVDPERHRVLEGLMLDLDEKNAACEEMDQKIEQAKVNIENLSSSNQRKDVEIAKKNGEIFALEKMNSNLQSQLAAFWERQHEMEIREKELENARAQFEQDKLAFAAMTKINNIVNLCCDAMQTNGQNTELTGGKTRKSLAKIVGKAKGQLNGMMTMKPLPLKEQFENIRNTCKVLFSQVENCLSCCINTEHNYTKEWVKQFFDDFMAVDENVEYLYPRKNGRELSVGALMRVVGKLLENKVLYGTQTSVSKGFLFIGENVESLRRYICDGMKDHATAQLDWIDAYVESHKPQITFKRPS